jgi:hypothetical protein
MISPIISCEIIKMNPPTDNQADALSRFMQDQAVNYPYSKEKKFIHRWKLCFNEAHSGFASAMVVTGTEQIVSIGTITPKRLWRKQTDQIWGEVGDAFTEQKFHRRGMFTQLVNSNREMAHKAGLNIIYSLPDNKSQSLSPFLNKCNFIIKNDLKFVQYFAILSTKVIASRGPFARIAWVRRLLASFSISKPSKWLFRQFYNVEVVGNSPIAVSEEIKFGIEFDHLWQKVRKTIPNAQVRDSRYLTWRYSDSTFPFKVLVARLDGIVVGYIVALTIRNEEEDFVHTIMIDWLFDDTCRIEIPPVLLSAFIKLALEEEADLMSSTVCVSSAHPLPFSKFHFMHSRLDTVAVFFNNSDGNSVCDDPSPWHFTFSDTDAF